MGGCPLARDKGCVLPSLAALDYVRWSFDMHEGNISSIKTLKLCYHVTFALGDFEQTPSAVDLSRCLEQPI